MKLFCIVIPIYKEKLDLDEKFSLKRLNHIIGGKDYDVYFVKPNSLNDLDEYRLLLKNLKVNTISFDDKYFKNTSTYSKLLINSGFYKKFKEYEYMYIYQTDCYLIKDDLEYWSKQEYDYIGAPIFAYSAGWKDYKHLDNQGKNIPSKYIPQVGNGGFSLRRISTFIDMLSIDGDLISTGELKREELLQVVFEDKFLCNDLESRYELIRPNWKIATHFAIDMNPDIAYRIFNNQIEPMCVHAWPKNIEFWKTRFKDLDQDTIRCCENKHGDFLSAYYNN